MSRVTAWRNKTHFRYQTAAGTFLMSLSKQVTATAEQPRQPKCSRCRHHGIVVRQKGHMKFCPFLQCDCWKCFLITERTRITALQRNLKKVQNKPRSAERQRACANTGDRRRRAEAEGACSSSTAAGGARPSATSQRSTGAPERPTTNDRRPLDLNGGPSAGGEGVGGSDNRDVLPVSSSEEGCKITPYRAPYFAEFGQSTPLPFIHFPFRMGSHYPRSYVPCPNLMRNMPWLPPVPAGLCNQLRFRPIIFPQFQQGALHSPSPIEPGTPADCRQVFFTLQPPPFLEAFQQEQHLQPPVVKHAEPDIVQLE